MKPALLFSCLLLLILQAHATTYYFSATGNDANAGTSTSAPFKTLDKLNHLKLTPGDSVLLKCGDVFRGQVFLDSAHGSAASPIVISSYGTGAKPVISGAELITGWVFDNVNQRYQASFTPVMTNFFVNSKEQTLARFPNDHQYLNLTVADSMWLKDDTAIFLAPGLVDNAKICIHTAQWCWEKTNVQSRVGDTLKYTAKTTINAIGGYGYFLYDNLAHLDVETEWKQDTIAHILYYKPVGGADPTADACEGSVYLNGITIRSNDSYITIEGLAFEKQANAGVLITNPGNRYIKVNNCYFARQYNHGVNDRGKYNEISNSSFREIDGIAMYISNNATNCTVHHNQFKDIGQYRNGGIGTQINLTAIKAAFVDSCYIHHNSIDGAGYCGIATDGTFHTVEKNNIQHTMLINNDGAAIKTFGLGSHDLIIRNNFISSSDGSNEGTNNGSFVTPAIYFDFNSNNSLVQDNTIFGRTQKGIFMNSGTFNNTIKGNVVYGFNFGIDLNGESQTDSVLKGMNVTHNSFFALETNAIVIRQTDFTFAYNQGVIDSNYYFQPYNTKCALRFPGPTLTFADWQNAPNNPALGIDVHTKHNSFSWLTTENNSQLFIDSTDNAMVQDLSGFQWQDLDGNIVTSLTLQPWTSKILIKTTVFPVKLISFTAAKANKDVSCVWQTAYEQGTDHYNVERSLNGREFASIGTVTANGNGNTLSTYSFTDINAADINSTYLYYRLKIIGKDQVINYSPVVRVSWKSSAAISVYPNPATGFVKVEAEDVKMISFYDASGKLVLEKSDCSNANVINVSGLAKGSYWLCITDSNNKRQVQLLVVQ